MKPKITMCNYYGMCDSNGDVVGHTVKVTNEYSDILKEKYAIELAASPCVVKNIDASGFVKVNELKFDICINGNSVLKRLFDKFKLLSNIHQILKEGNVYFFYQVDFFFFFYIYLFYRVKKERKIVCLIYHQDFTGGILSEILQNIYRKALKKIDGVLYTQIDNPISHENSMWIPDFFYSNKQYASYQSLEKKPRIVCVGTMNRYKQLEELIEVFADSSIELFIAGRFDDPERYKRLIANKTNNIEIQNRNLSYKEYLETIATSKYSILPYDMNQYQNRTSGVLLESIYVGSIPIAPRKLLEQNHLPGIGYDSLGNLRDNQYLFADVDTWNYGEIYLLSDQNQFITFMGNFFQK